MQTDPQFAAAWNDVQAQLIAEGSGVVNAATGAVNDVFTGAKIQLADAFSQLAGQSFGLSTSISSGINNAYDVAKKYVMVGQTVLGAVNTVSGLINTSGATTGTPQQALAFTGTMLGTITTLGIAAGSVTAGLGAAVVAGGAAVIAGIGAALQASGLLGQPPPAGTICGFPLDQKPDWTVGCLAAWGTTAVPGSEIWSAFPDPSKPADAAWFEGGSQHIGPGQWRNAFYGVRGPGRDQGYSGGPNPAGNNLRPIDNGFFDYVYMEHILDTTGTYANPLVSSWLSAGVAPFQISHFLLGLFEAWKTNAAYALNGIQPQPSWAVTVHFIRMWNRSHTSSSIATYPSDQSAIGAGISSSEYVVNMGPLRTVIATQAAVDSIAGKSTTSTAAKVATAAVAAPAALAVGTIVYAWATGRAVDTVFWHLWFLSRRTWDRVTRGVRKNPLALMDRRHRMRRRG
jgi:hypothetical protein